MGDKKLCQFCGKYEVFSGAHTKKLQKYIYPNEKTRLKWVKVPIQACWSCWLKQLLDFSQNDKNGGYCDDGRVRLYTLFR